ncbi:MAG: hypothetical protein K2X77_15280 [Candidatus Obscuribacterales bacterium]|nr:hypothetical protein [Candidatus Obscuribacterales bacterium]
MRTIRKSSGSMLVLIVFLLGIFVVFALGAFTVNNFLFLRTRAQDRADNLALLLASKINTGDRVGQMNELQARSRELIFNSRERIADCHGEELDMLSPIAEQLLNEAREGHALLERESNNLVSQICKEVKESALAHNSALSDLGIFKMGGLLTEQARIERVELGSIKDIPSNAKSDTVFEGLSEFDLQQNHSHKTNGLYRANIDAKIPPPDGDLSFKISALAPNVRGTCSPAHNVNAHVFTRMDTLIDNEEGQPCHPEFAPCAVQVHCKMPTTLGIKGDYRADLTFVSTAATNGAIKTE